VLIIVERGPPFKLAKGKPGSIIVELLSGKGHG
jgi:hypothetical protein